MKNAIAFRSGRLLPNADAIRIAACRKVAGLFLRLRKRQILLGGNQVRYHNELALARGMGAAAVPTLLGRPKAAVTLQCDHPRTAHQSIDLIDSQVPLDDIEAGYGGAEHRRRSLNRLTEHCVGVPSPQARTLRDVIGLFGRTIPSRPFSSTRPAFPVSASRDATDL